jgi:HTH-type transcriptional regulator/antitoxin HigA
MESKRGNDFCPTIAVPVGATIRENMIALGMDQEELSARLGITPKHLSNLINGHVTLTYDMALKLEDVIGPDADFWVKLESNYQLQASRLAEEKKMQEEIDLLAEIPYQKMAKYRWITAHGRTPETVNSLREFYGVASLGLIRESADVMFRKQKVNGKISDYAVLAWLRKAEINGNAIATSGFDRPKLRKMIPLFRKLTLKPPKQFYPEIVEGCASCGVALTLVEYLPNTGICGATLWRGNKAIIALSAMGKTQDKFWFTFFHEIAHLIKQDKKLCIHYDNTVDNSSEERDIDLAAGALLIPDAAYENYVSNFDFAKEENIIKYAKQIGIAPDILLGRLQHDQKIAYSRLNYLKRPLDIEELLNTEN